jgi:hypothetical protein
MARTCLHLRRLGRSRTLQILTIALSQQQQPLLQMDFPEAVRAEWNHFDPDLLLVHSASRRELTVIRVSTKFVICFIANIYHGKKKERKAKIDVMLIDCISSPLRSSRSTATWSRKKSSFSTVLTIAMPKPQNKHTANDLNPVALQVHELERSALRAIEEMARKKEEERRRREEEERRKREEEEERKRQEEERKRREEEGKKERNRSRKIYQL